MISTSRSTKVTLSSSAVTPSVLTLFFQAEDRIRDYKVTGVQTCALPICDDARRHVGEFEAHSLEVADRRLELTALRRVRQRMLEGGSRDPDCLRGDAEPSVVER